MLGTEKGKAIRFSEGDVRRMGRATRGVKGIELQKGDSVKDIVVVDKDATLLTVCGNGYGKRTEYSEYPIQRRGGRGVINIKTTERNGNVIALKNVKKEDELMMMTANGMIIRTGIKSIRSIGRSTQGVKLISLKGRDKLVSVASLVGEVKEEMLSEQAKEIE
jgi:DNA gyrase subunit A